MHWNCGPDGVVYIRSGIWMFVGIWPPSSRLDNFRISQLLTCLKVDTGVIRIFGRDGEVELENVARLLS